jgi:hypothetical protein
VVVVVWLLAGCSVGTGDDRTAAGGHAGHVHSHGPGGAQVSWLVGDGTRAYEVGYTLDRVTLPRAAGVPGRISFRIRTSDGAPLTRYLVEQTRRLHLYVVRTDLAVFRHLHPRMDGEGTWSAPVTLPKPGEYRVIAEFVAEDQSGSGDHVMLGKAASVPGPWTRQPVTLPDVGEDGAVRVDAEGRLRTGQNGRLTLVVTDAAGRPVKLGSYLGSFAHVTAMHVASGSVVHMHPLGQPELDSGGTRLVFHSEFDKPGEYLCFVQVRVDGFLHTLRVGAEVSRRGR